MIHLAWTTIDPLLLLPDQRIEHGEWLYDFQADRYIGRFVRRVKMGGGFEFAFRCCFSISVQELEDAQSIIGLIESRLCRAADLGGRLNVTYPVHDGTEVCAGKYAPIYPAKPAMNLPKSGATNLGTFTNGGEQ